MGDDRFEYDVALSFAGEDRAVAEEFVSLLRAKDIHVLYDEYRAVELGGSDFITHVAEIFRTKAWYYVMLVSRHYPLKQWTEAERTSVQEHALRDANEYILPIRLDESEVTGFTEAAGYRDLRQHSTQAIADLLENKLAETKARSSPPSQSHDLRSGNVPSTHDRSDDP